MNNFNNFPDFSQMRKDLDDSQKRMEEYYSQSLYNPNPPENIKAQNNQVFDTTAFQENTSPQPLAPLGANARVVDPQRNPIEQFDYGSVSKTTSQIEADKAMNIWDQKFQSKEYQTELGDAAKKNASGSGASASGIASGVSAGLGFASKAYGTLQEVDQSESESWKKTGQLTMSGASTGMQIGGPWGAAIGSVVGGAAGLINMGADRNKRNQMTREKIKKENKDTFDKRQRDYEIKEAERQIELLTSMSKSQLNYLK